MELLPKIAPPCHSAPSPSSGERPTKAPKMDETPAKATSKADFRKQKKNNFKTKKLNLNTNKALYADIPSNGLGGLETIPRIRLFGRRKAARSKFCYVSKKNKKGNGKAPKGNAKKGENRPTATATTDTVRGPSSNLSLDSEICVLDGKNIRRLRGGLGLCSPGIIKQGGPRKKFWLTIRETLLEVFGRNVITSEIIRHPNLLTPLKGNV